MTVRTRVLCALVLLVAGGCARHHRESFVLATTTSLESSGLLAVLEREFERDSGIRIQPVVVGSGLALRLAAGGRADATITHDPAAERALIQEGKAEIYAQFMSNEFVIVGPAADPAQVRSASSAVDAFRRIARAGSRFCSRNDQSGTHTKEMMIWRAAGVVPSGPAYLRMGQSMAQVLRSASEVGAYTLTDLPTFDQLARSLDLVVLYRGDPVLANVYGLIVVRAEGRPHDNALRFSRWMLEGRGREVVSGFKVGGVPAFHLVGNVRSRPAAAATHS
ncbi:MAG: substrate-binding domain-containing protein [Thermoanaerobaculia bacterium]